MTPWAKGLAEARERREHVDDPYGYCLPPGVPRINNIVAFKLVTTPQETVLLYETAVGLMFRQVFTDGRPLPEITEPTWLGYSVGRWDGDTFIVDSVGFKDGGWLDTRKARPHSTEMRLTERASAVDRSSGVDLDSCTHLPVRNGKSIDRPGRRDFRKTVYARQQSAVELDRLRVRVRGRWQIDTKGQHTARIETVFHGPERPRGPREQRNLHEQDNGQCDLHGHQDTTNTVSRSSANRTRAVHEIRRVGAP